MIENLSLFDDSGFAEAINIENEGVAVFPWVFDLCEFPYYTTCYSIYPCMLGYTSSDMLVRVPGVSYRLVECPRGCMQSCRINSMRTLDIGFLSYSLFGCGSRFGSRVRFSISPLITYNYAFINDMLVVT